MTSRITTLLIALLAATTAMPQKPMERKVRQDMSQARDMLKKGKTPEQAEKLMTGLLKDSANQGNKKIYDLWLQAVQKQYDAANERLYLRQKQDTAAFFALVRRMFTVAEALDSIDALPNKKGQVNPEYRKDNAEQLNRLRPNLFNGGTYHTRKRDFQQAFTYFEQYLNCQEQPLFSGYNFDTDDRQRMAEAAYWATYCGYRLQNPLLTLRYRRQALADTTKAAYTLQYVAEARRWLHDDSLYAETLHEGFRRYPLNAYFFPRLIDYYGQHGHHHEALALADSALLVAPRNQIFSLAKAKALFNLESYDETIAMSDSLIARIDTMAEPYYLAGAACLNKALKLNPLSDKKQLRKVYQQARTYMERYQMLAPDEQQKWAPLLYRIYLNLNMGRQFDEIDRLLRKK